MNLVGLSSPAIVGEGYIGRWLNMGEQGWRVPAHEVIILRRQSGKRPELLRSAMST